MDKYWSPELPEINIKNESVLSKTKSVRKNYKPFPHYFWRKMMTQLNKQPQKGDNRLTTQERAVRDGHQSHWKQDQQSIKKLSIRSVW